MRPKQAKSSITLFIPEEPVGLVGTARRPALHIEDSREYPSASPLRHELGKLTDTTDQGVAATREAVRGCQPFKVLCAGDQARVKNVLLHVKVP